MFPSLCLQGGVAGGSILRGVLKMGDTIEIRPGDAHSTFYMQIMCGQGHSNHPAAAAITGIITKKPEGGFNCRPIVSTVINMRAENNALNYAAPGGLIGVGTAVDPTLCRADRLGAPPSARTPPFHSPQCGAARRMRIPRWSSSEILLFSQSSARSWASPRYPGQPTGRV